MDPQLCYYFNWLRDVAQFGSAPALGAGCRRFKSCHPDFFISKGSYSLLASAVIRREEHGQFGHNR